MIHAYYADHLRIVYAMPTPPIVATMLPLDTSALTLLCFSYRPKSSDVDCTCARYIGRLRIYMIMT